MLNPKATVLSPTDVKILAALTRELTSTDASTVSGIPYEYCKKRIGMLKKKQYIEARPVGNQVYYHTIRLPETEEYFKLAETRSSEKIEYEFEFFGEYGNFTKHINSVVAEREQDTQKRREVHLFKLVQLMVASIKVRSFRKSLGQLVDSYPTEKRMREYLLQRIVLARKELALAEELYKAKGLWSEDTKVWQQISRAEPSDAVIKAYELLGSLF